MNNDLQMFMFRHTGKGVDYGQLRGVLIMMWILSLANGAFYFPEGRSLPIKDTLVCAEWGQAILVAEETLNGPVA
jgi:hypothetical protein